MHKIEIKHSVIKINDYNMGDCEFLENSFMIYDPITHTKYIYAFNQGKITNLSKDITNFLYSIDIEKVRFGVDYKTNRLLICITTKDNNIYTISYFIGKACYLSLHDYKFDYCYQIYNKTYFLDEDIWIRSTMVKVANIAAARRLCIIPDVRFANEANAIRFVSSPLYGEVIKVNRNNDDNSKHSSEAIDFNVYFEIDNNGTLMQLFYKVLEICQTLV